MSSFALGWMVRALAGSLKDVEVFLAAAQQIAQNVHIRHDADTPLGAEAADLRGSEIPDVPGAEDVCLAVRGCVQYRVVSGI